MTDSRRRPMLDRRRTATRRLIVLAAMVLGTACMSGEEPPPDEPSSGSEAGGGSGIRPDPDGDRGDEPATDPGTGTDTAEPPAEPPPEPAEQDAVEPVPDLTVALRLTEVGRVDSPTAGAVGPDGTIHVTARSGTVHQLRDDGVGDAIVDVRDEVSTGGERGLLGIAFAPEGGAMYLSYTDVAGDTVVEEFGFHDGRVDTRRRRVVFTLDQPYRNHNGGHVTFGPDGLLYLGLGDGGGAGDPLATAQDLTTPLGALLRVDPTRGDPYEIPEDNPFVDDPDARGEIYAYGLRNPWRFSFDRATGDVWIADVGQDSREEVNRVDGESLAGANFGWSLMEGDEPFAGSEPEDHVPPVATYETSSTRCAVTGGYVYRGSDVPELRGAYLYSDFCDGRLRAIVVDEAGEVVDEADLGVDGGSVVSFVEDAAGELYVLDLGGAISRLGPA